MAQAPEDPLVAQALNARSFDAEKDAKLLEAIKNLTPEEAAFFLHRLEMAIRKRKIQITGYLVAMFVWLVGMVLALAYVGTHDGFVGWVFLVPFALVGAILYAVGGWAERVAKTPPPETVARSPGAPADDAGASAAADVGSAEPQAERNHDR